MKNGRIEQYKNERKTRKGNIQIVKSMKVLLGKKKDRILLLQPLLDSISRSNFFPWKFNQGKLTFYLFLYLSTIYRKKVQFLQIIKIKGFILLTVQAIFLQTMMQGDGNTQAGMGPANPMTSNQGYNMPTHSNQIVPKIKDSESKKSKCFLGGKCYRCLIIYMAVLTAIIVITGITMVWWKLLPSAIYVYAQIYVSVKIAVYGVAWANCILKISILQTIWRWVMLLMCFVLTCLTAAICAAAALAIQFLNNLCSNVNSTTSGTSYNAEANSQCSTSISTLEHYLYILAALFVLNDFILPIVAYCFAKGFKEHLQKK